MIDSIYDLGIDTSMIYLTRYQQLIFSYYLLDTWVIHAFLNLW